MPKTPRRLSKAKGTRNTAVSRSTSAARSTSVARSTSAAGRQNAVPSDAGSFPSDSIASLSLATLLEAVSQAGAPAQGQALATGEST